MKKIIAQVLLVLIIFTIDGCNIIKRKYRKGFYRHKHEKAQWNASKESADLTHSKRNEDTFALTREYMDTVEATATVADEIIQPVKNEQDILIEPGETSQRKNQTHISNKQQRNYKHVHEKFITNKSYYKRGKIKRDRLWWDLNGKKILITFLILLSAAACFIILLSSPLTLGTLSWAWFALSLIPAAFMPQMSEVVDNKALLFLLGLMAFNIPVPLAFAIRFILTINTNLFLLVTMIYAAVVVAAGLFALAFDPEISLGIFGSGIMAGIVIGILVLLVLLMILLFANMSFLSAVGIVLIGAALLLFFGACLVAMTFSR